MSTLTLYRWLCGLLGIGMVAFGLLLFVSFFRALAPGGTVQGPLSPIGPNGIYFMAFTGTALVGWGGCLFSVVRNPSAGRTIGTATAFALVLSAVYRLLGWLMGDYSQLGDVLRVEAGTFLLLALALVWLRPAANATSASTPAPATATAAG